MNVGAIGSRNTADMEIAQKKVTKENSTQEKEASSSIIQEDTVTISEEGRQKSKSQRIQMDDRDSQDTASSGTKGEGETKINVDDIKKDLELKKSETKKKQKQLEDLQRQAEDDPAKQAEIQKAKAKVAQLKKEAEKLKSQTYSA